MLYHVKNEVENNGMIRVKICGITNPEDASMAADAGADAIGLNFVGGPRRIETDQVGPIVAALPPFCVPVALVNLDANPLGDELWNTLSQLHIRTIQLYGTEPEVSAASILRAGFLPVLVHRVNPDAFPDDLESRLKVLDNTAIPAVVFDAHHPSQMGGTGVAFDWQLLRQSNERTAAHWPRVILAGGLNPANVTEAVQITRPYAVDVSSGVETAPGQKCPKLMRAFIQAAKR